jgi:beta-N-acetylhexosaminidase
VAPFRSFIAGCEGTALSEAERGFFAEARPCGLILFARNCQSPEQLRDLTADFRRTVGSDALVFIDQEGGRVQRLEPPQWRRMPPARAYGNWYETEPDAAIAAAFAGARLIAAELRDCGIDVDCAPVLDIPQKDAHEIIGDRAYGTDPEIVAALGRAFAEGCLAGGVLPVIKHIPGHGRARADSHLELPVIEAEAHELETLDFRPFTALKDMPLAMTAHVVLTAFDARRPASVSPIIVDQVIRGLIGYDGLLMSDDLSMAALGGTFAERANDVICAGCDIALHCNGDLSEMQEVAAAVPELEGKSAERFARALGKFRAPEAVDAEMALASVQAAFTHAPGPKTEIA